MSASEEDGAEVVGAGVVDWVDVELQCTAAVDHFVDLVVQVVACTEDTEIGFVVAHVLSWRRGEFSPDLLTQLVWEPREQSEVGHFYHLGGVCGGY
ncbi:hypothetical protein I7I53_10660 [Histoplasma capsulatum var. duboisii H88]|uniref:Uncharacterized protein n=1 Tax=Ajellomyces capsulatus (strain H88) TaxID=544711 RepID=A0A8A1LB82_AJEC8|nr:hypothetical protein I7I53_10660 [Histoplasma capsulatum var. duboisii H88]